MTVVDQVFNKLRWRPYQHQVDAWCALKQGKPIVLRAPTGSGKTEAVFLPFVTLSGNSLPSRLLYALPLRVWRTCLAFSRTKSSERQKWQRCFTILVNLRLSGSNMPECLEVLMPKSFSLTPLNAITLVFLPLRWTFKRPDGAMTTRLQHIEGIEGVVLFARSAVPVPLLSSLRDDYRGKLKKLAEKQGVKMREFDNLVALTDILKGLGQAQPMRIS